MSVTELSPEAAIDDETVESEGPSESPSIFSVVNRYIVGRVAVTPPAPDGSRIVRLDSGTGSAVVELNLSHQLCEFLSAKLVEIEIIAEDVEDDAETGE